MFKTILNIIFILELVFLIIVCTTVSEYMSQLDTARTKAYDGDSTPVVNVFKNMSRDLKNIDISDILEKTKEILKPIIHRIMIEFDNIMKYV